MQGGNIENPKPLPVKKIGINSGSSLVDKTSTPNLNEASHHKPLKYKGTRKDCKIFP